MKKKLKPKVGDKVYCVIDALTYAQGFYKVTVRNISARKGKFISNELDEKNERESIIIDEIARRLYPNDWEWTEKEATRNVLERIKQRHIEINKERDHLDELHTKMIKIICDYSPKLKIKPRKETACQKKPNQK